MYDAAFDAWAVARDDIHLDWSLRTDPGRLAPALPKVMRDAADFVEQHGTHLGERQDDLAARLKAPYTNRVQRALREALSHADDEPARDTVQRIAAVADEYGLTVPHPPVPLPPADVDDIYLVCWTAIIPDSGTADGAPELDQ